MFSNCGSFPHNVHFPLIYAGLSRADGWNVQSSTEFISRFDSEAADTLRLWVDILRSSSSVSEVVAAIHADSRAGLTLRTFVEEYGCTQVSIGRSMLCIKVADNSIARAYASQVEPPRYTDPTGTCREAVSEGFEQVALKVGRAAQSTQLENDLDKAAWKRRAMLLVQPAQCRITSLE